ncbi:iron uptake porin [Synechococcus sp. CC9605]|uniref:iron uptake porin n=1 Tax=Synechococcus sp. (strain CC9605) TaxID=110662 RepID=UPI00005D5E4E|nr:iron uptake porin [Synechococcus sp. CC9605]ABB36098.1 possible porin [Synechococcus sp. CC9605]
MKLFQQLLVAPAALGLLAPLAVVNSPAANAAELNINDVSDYAATASGNSLDQVTSVTQFSDVYPTDWAYQALANLVETYGCVAGYPNGTFRGNRAMTRYEAAALLNACLDRITEVTDELRRLLKEFETELAILKGRVDGLEARVGELEATQFSTTTKLSGTSNWVAGATRAKGDNYNTGGEKGARDDWNAKYGGFSFSYDVRLALKTSFSGKDLLYTRLRAGNMYNVFEAAPFVYWPGSLNVYFDTNNVLLVDRFYYRFPLGNSFTVQVGPTTRNTEMMGYKASAYARGGDKVLDFFGGSLGTPGVWNKETGAGFGAFYSNKKQVEKGNPYFTLSASYVADWGEGNDSNPNTGGFMTDNSEGNITTQIAFGNKQWGLAAGYRYGQCGARFRTGTQFALGDSYGTPCTVEVDGKDERTNADSHSWSFHGFWSPEESGWMPSISAGVGASYLNGNDAWKDNTNKRAMASWMVGLTWNDVFLEGNALGYAVGQPQFVYDVEDGFVADGGYAMELWYSFQVTDNIQITPAVYWLSRPFGDNTQNVNGDYKSLGVFGGLVQTTFKF